MRLPNHSLTIGHVKIKKISNWHVKTRKNKPEIPSGFKREPRASNLKVLCKCCASAMQVLCKFYARELHVLCKCYANAMVVSYQGKKSHWQVKKARCRSVSWAWFTLKNKMEKAPELGLMESTTSEMKVFATYFFYVRRVLNF